MHLLKKNQTVHIFYFPIFQTKSCFFLSKAKIKHFKTSAAATATSDNIPPMRWQVNSDQHRVLLSKLFIRLHGPLGWIKVDHHPLVLKRLHYGESANVLHNIQTSAMQNQPFGTWPERVGVPDKSVTASSVVTAALRFCNSTHMVVNGDM